jgi:hypothetical protein
MHGEAVRNGGMFQWAHFFAPEPELVKWFESASDSAPLEWGDIEPEFS